MAYHPVEGLVDAFGGREDLAAGIIRCVGEAERRFDEDALRILRALRFASTYGFAIEENTAAAVHSLKHTLEGVAAERVRVEVAKLLCGKGVGGILRAYHDVICQVLPWLRPMIGFEQHTPFHRFDVWEHTVRAVEAVPATEVMRLTMLLHDSGKPAAFTMDENGVGHAYGHQKISAGIADEALTALRADNATHARVLKLVECHDWPLSTDAKLLKRRLHVFGEETLWQLIEVQRADAMGKGTRESADIEHDIEAIRTALRELIALRPCVTLKDLALRGGDLIAAGVGKGKIIGQCLDYLLGEVMAERLENDRDALLQAALAWKMEEQG